MRVLFSFPHRIGADRICGIAWHQVEGLQAAGADVTVFTGSVHKSLPEGVRVHSTLAWNNFRIPYRLIGSRRAFALHDRIVARHLRKIGKQFDAIHTWPLGSLATLEAAAELGIPTFLERCNAHTRFAYDVVLKECERLGVTLPPDHEHAFKPDVLAREEAEYNKATYLLCPSDFVVRSFLDEGYAADKLLRHIYGVDEKVFHPAREISKLDRGLTMISVGVCAVRKGLHYALEAWVKSSASERGQFLIAGEFLPDYQSKLAPLLAHPSVKVLGHRTDVPELLRRSDILVLPSIEEGFGLVCTEAMTSGCVPLVSEACTDICRHMSNALVHQVGDVDALQQHISMLDGDRQLLARLRQTGLETVPEITWHAAGRKLLQLFQEHAKQRGMASDIHAFA